MQVFSKSSNSGSTRVQEIVCYDPLAHQPAAAVLLRNQLLEQDEDYILSDYKVRVEFSRDMLTGWQRSLGTLICVYCGTFGLRIKMDENRVSASKMATLEHLTALSKGGRFRDKSILVCACNRCNTKRGNKPVEEYLESKKISKNDFEYRCKIYFELSSEEA